MHIGCRLRGGGLHACQSVEIRRPGIVAIVFALRLSNPAKLPGRGDSIRQLSRKGAFFTRLGCTLSAGKWHLQGRVGQHASQSLRVLAIVHLIKANVDPSKQSGVTSQLIHRLRTCPSFRSTTWSPQRAGYGRSLDLSPRIVENSTKGDGP